MITILVALGFYTTALMLIAVASRSINASVVTMVVNIMSAVIPIGAALPLIERYPVAQNKEGYMYAAIAGACIAVFGIALARSFADSRVAIVSPIVFGGSIFLTAILSALIFKERISMFQGIGLACIFVGLSFIVYSKITGK